MANGNHWLQILCNYKSIRLLILDFGLQISNGEKKEYFFDFRFAPLQKLPIFAPAIRPCGATE
jgi:hypothetical protein